MNIENTEADYPISTPQDYYVSMWYPIYLVIIFID